MSEIGEYWKEIKPILKEINQQERAEHYDERIEYAIKQFEENQIPYKLCNKELMILISKYINKEIDFKKLANVNVEANKSKICRLGWLAEVPGKS